MKFMVRVAQYTWQDYKTNDDILSELKITRVEKEIQNYRTESIHVRRMDRDRETATLNYEMPTVWEKKPRATAQKTCRLLMGSEKVTRPRNLQGI